MAFLDQILAGGLYRSKMRIISGNLKGGMMDASDTDDSEDEMDQEQEVAPPLTTHLTDPPDTQQQHHEPRVSRSVGH